LVGFKNVPINATYFDDLNNTMRHKSKQFIERVTRQSYWKKKGAVNMKFDAVVGNPPYQENISSNKGNTSLSKQLFPIFIQNSILLDTQYVSLITPSRWFTANAQDRSFIRLREFIKSKNHMSKIFNYPDNQLLFNNVEIAGGVNYFLYDKSNTTGKIEFTEYYRDNYKKVNRHIFEEGINIIISINKNDIIIKK